MTSRWLLALALLCSASARATDEPPPPSPSSPPPTAIDTIVGSAAPDSDREAIRDAALGATLATSAWTATALAGAYADQLGHGPEASLVPRLSALQASALAQSETIDRLLEQDRPSTDGAVLLGKLRKVLLHVADQAKALRSYATSGDGSAARDFRNARKLGWVTLLSALDLNADDVAALAPGGASLGVPTGH